MLTALSNDVWVRLLNKSKGDKAAKAKGPRNSVDNESGETDVKYPMSPTDAIVENGQSSMRL